MILTTYFPRLERGAHPSPTLGPHVFQTTAFSFLKVPTFQHNAASIIGFRRRGCGDSLS